MKKTHLISLFSIILIFTFLNLNVNNEFDFLMEANAQDGTSYMTCGDHADTCNSSTSGCEGGVEGQEHCMIYCGGVFGPWIYCNGNTDPE